MSESKTTTISTPTASSPAEKLLRFLQTGNTLRLNVRSILKLSHQLGVSYLSLSESIDAVINSGAAMLCGYRLVVAPSPDWLDLPAEWECVTACALAGLSKTPIYHQSSADRDRYRQALDRYRQRCRAYRARQQARGAE